MIHGSYEFFECPGFWIVREYEYKSQEKYILPEHLLLACK